MCVWVCARGPRVQVCALEIDRHARQLSGATMGLPTEEWKAKACFSEAEPGDNAEAKVKKHVPVVAIEGGKAKLVVGHGMEPAHWIQAVWIEVDGKSVAEKEFTAADKPEAELDIPAGAKSITAYSMCNLHDVFATAEISVD
jgi:desulfoferrodoxin (superoxide reductase-like protein)